MTRTICMVHTAVDEDLEKKNSVFWKDVLPKREYKVIEKEEKKRQFIK